MTRHRASEWIIGPAILCALWLPDSRTPYAGQSPSTTIDAAFERFWDANSPEQAVDRLDDIVKSGVTFEDAGYALLSRTTRSTSQSSTWSNARSLSMDFR